MSRAFPLSSQEAFIWKVMVYPLSWVNASQHWRCSGASSGRARVSHPFCPSYASRWCFPALISHIPFWQYMALVELVVCVWENWALRVALFPSHLCRLVFPYLVVNNHSFMKFRFRNAFLLERGRVVCSQFKVFVCIFTTQPMIACLRLICLQTAWWVLQLLFWNTCIIF